MLINNLYRAIKTKLTADSTLVSLTGHSSSDPRIFLGYPTINSAAYPCLCYSEINIKSAVDDGPTGVNKALVNFVAFSKTKVTVTDIISRLKTLLDSDNVTQENSFLDFTDNYICNKFTIFNSISECDFISEYDVFTQSLMAKIIWVDK